MTSLFYTTSYLHYSPGETEVVKLLLSRGCDPNLVNLLQWSALLAAAEGGFVQIADALVIAGADIDAEDSDGDSALILAAGKAHHDIVQVSHN